MDLKKNNTELNSLENLLILEEAKKLKTVFLDNMSHELRTPVTVILGYAGILYDEIQDPDLKEMAEIILKSSNRLTEALNLLLDQSDVESERLKVELKSVNLYEILKEIANVYGTVAKDKNLEFIFNSSITEANCQIDKKMFDKVMTNILTNAIKFTDKGSISILLSEEKASPQKNFIIQIKDTGIGIPEEKLSIIFEAFRQVSEGINRSYQGIGLGLSVSKKFIELMNGEISVKSKPNQGTTFFIKFPEAT